MKGGLMHINLILRNVLDNRRPLHVCAVETQHRL